jgi:hypothetical protein
VLPSLHRWTLIDRYWGRAEFTDLARFWLTAFEDVRPVGARVTWRIAARVWGFPRSVCEALATQLSVALVNAKLGAPVELADSDTISVEWRGNEHQRPPLWLVVAALGEALPPGLAVAWSLALEHDGRARPRHLSAATVFLVGETNGASVLVKALSANPGTALDPLVCAGGGEWDLVLLETFRRFAESRALAPGFLCQLFPRAVPKPDPRVDPVVGTRNARLGRRRFRRRVVTALFPLLAGLVLFPVLIVLDELAWACLAVPISCAVALVVWLVLYFIERRRWADSFRAYRFRYDYQYWEVTRYALVPSVRGFDAATLEDDTATLVRKLADPLVRKFTAEVLEAGFVHVADAASLPHGHATLIHRIFLAPDGTTYLTLGFGVGTVSGKARSVTWSMPLLNALCQTFFRDDDRFETGNYAHALLELGREVPDLQFAELAPETLPLDVYRAHAERVRAWAERTAAVAIRHESPEQVLARQNLIADQEYRVYRKRPYDRRDHMRWFLAREEPQVQPE